MQKIPHKLRCSRDGVCRHQLDSTIPWICPNRDCSWSMDSADSETGDAPLYMRCAPGKPRGNPAVSVPGFSSRRPSERVIRTKAQLSCKPRKSFDGGNAYDSNAGTGTVRLDVFRDGPVCRALPIVLRCAPTCRSDSRTLGGLGNRNCGGSIYAGAGQLPADLSCAAARQSPEQRQHTPSAHTSSATRERVAGTRARRSTSQQR